MFKRIRRKLATATRKRTQRIDVNALPKPRFESASNSVHTPRGSRRSLLSPELRSPREARLAAKRNLFSKLENKSHFKLDRDELWGDDIGERSGPRLTSRENGQEDISPKAQDSLRELEDGGSPGFDAMRFITVQSPHKKILALLLPAAFYQRTQALVHARQDLRAADCELATTAAELQNLVSARSSLDEHDGHEVPGAFFDEDSYADRERRRLLMSTIEKKNGFCRQTMECLEVQKPRLEADFEVLQELFFDGLERAVRDDATADASASEGGDLGKSAVWWTS